MSTEHTDVIDSIALPIVVVGCDTAVARFNTAAAALLALAPSDIGRPVSDIQALTGVASDLQELCEHVIAGGAVSQREVRIRDGSWFVATIVPYTRTDREIAGAVLTLTSITALRASVEQAIHEREYTKAILNTGVEALVVLDADLRVQTANRAFYTMFQLSRDVTQGVPLFDLESRQWDIPPLRVFLNEILSTENSQSEGLEVEHAFPAIGLRVMRFNARRLPRQANRAQMIVLTINDITERKRAEEALRASARAKDEFLAMLGHELRNPLGAVASAVRLLDVEGRSPADAARARAVISRQLDHLTRLVDDLLDVSRLTSAKVRLSQRPLEFAQSAKAVVDGLVSRGATNGLRVTFEGQPVWIYADETRIEQIITNLVGNAVKFTPPGGTIAVTVGREGAHAVLAVKDSGVGISADAIASIFDPFVQGERSVDRSQGGLGLGLTVVRRLVELHGGSVQASSGGPDKGSVFTLRLPVTAAPASSVAERPPATAPAPSPRSVLIVEDNADVREMLAMTLRHDGHEVHEAVDGPSGLEAALALQPDIALIDVGLPALNGYDVARGIRERAGGKRIYLVALTGYGQPEDRRRAEDAGFDEHIVKPVDPERLGVLIVAASTEGSAARFD